MDASDRQRGGIKNYDEFNIDVELSAIIEQKILPGRIAEKIGRKIKEKNIRLTRDQFYQLIERIQSALKGVETGYPSSSKLSRETETSPDNVNQTDMKKLVDSIELLKKKITILERNQLRGVKGITGSTVQTKDIHSLDFDVDQLQPLEQIPNDPESIVVVMKWLQYLVDKVGTKHLPDTLDYYVDIDWIGEDVRLDLIRYSKGIIDTHTKEGTTHLTTKDHIQSLLYIQKLKGIQLDDRFIWRIDREIEKMGKGLSDYIK